MTYIYIRRQGDLNEIHKYCLRFERYSDAELMEAFEKQKKLGFTGVHQQALYVLALRQEMHRRFGDAPILFANQSIIEFRSEDDASEP